MFKFKASKQFRKMRRASKAATPSCPSVRPRLEALEDRTMPSASPLDSQPNIITASPQAVPAAVNITPRM